MRKAMVLSGSLRFKIWSILLCIYCTMAVYGAVFRLSVFLPNGYWRGSLCIRPWLATDYRIVYLPYDTVYTVLKSEEHHPLPLAHPHGDRAATAQEHRIWWNNKVHNWKQYKYVVQAWISRDFILCSGFWLCATLEWECSYHSSVYRALIHTYVQKCMQKCHP